MSKYYPESKVEIGGFSARHYDILLDIFTLQGYSFMIQKVMQLLDIKQSDKILDLGAGTGKNACIMNKYLSKKGELIGLDISKEMVGQFKRNCSNFPNIKILNKRIDRDFGFNDYFDKVFVAFVLHGFPQEMRKKIINNVFKALENDGEFIILDYNEFILEELPFYFRIPFKKIECKYAFDFIKQNWKEILKSIGFKEFTEYYFYKDYIRLLKAQK